MGSLRNRYILLITLSYLVLALLWILLSDQLLSLFTNVDEILWLSTAKGLFFVLASAVGFFFALHAMPESNAIGQTRLQDVVFSGAPIGRKSAWITYSFAATITVLMLLVRLNMGLTSNHRPLMILFMLPIILSALLGGFGPGILATVLSAVNIDYFILSPQRNFEISDKYDLLQLSTLIFCGLIVSIFSEMLMRMRAKSERNLKLLNVAVSGTKDAIFVKDINGCYLVVNQAAANFVDKPLHEILGKDDRFLFPEITAKHIMKRDQDVMESGKIQILEEHIASFDGKKLIFDVTKGPMYDTSGNVIGLFGIASDITESKKKNEVLFESEARLQEAHRLAKMGDWSWDIDTDTHFWSKETYQIYGLNPELPPPDYLSVEKFFTRKSWRQLSKAVNSALKQGESYECDAEIIRQDGSHCWITARGKGVFDADGKVVKLYGTIQDITERKEAEINLQIAAVAFESQDSIMITDASLKILRINKAFTETFGFTAEEAIGKTAKLLHSGKQDISFYDELWAKIKAIGFWKGEILNRHKSGKLLYNLLSISAVKGDDNVVTHYVGSHVDITERKADADKVLHIALHDLLTQLPNRQLFNERLKHVIELGANSTSISSLLMIDLDNFKTLNDTLGHDIGDLLLQQAAERLASSVRAQDMVARLGGDEFVILLESLSDNMNEACELAKIIGSKILSTLNQPYQLAMHHYQSSSSIGLTMFSGNQLTISDLLKQADISMYSAKKSGRNALHFFDPLMQEAFNNRAALEIDLRKALECKQFQLYYQVQVDKFNNPIGAEALIRWIHPERGVVSPLEFIPLAEETGLILSIGQWVLETACAQLERWRHNELTKKLILSVNVSAAQFSQSDFVQQVLAILSHYAVEPHHLKLELTESLLLSNLDNIIDSMSKLEASGVLFSLDDFGTGYSSLQYLKTLPLDQLKIDQSFVRDIVNDNNDRSIVRTIIAMANSLGFDVIAEGVETEAQKDLLISKGCHQFQGYLFGRPVPIEQFNLTLEMK